jgi:hypothetical protein
LTGLADLPPLQDFIQHLDLQPMNESVNAAENGVDVAVTALVPTELLDMVNDDNQEN